MGPLATALTVSFLSLAAAAQEGATFSVIHGFRVYVPVVVVLPPQSNTALSASAIISDVDHIFRNYSGLTPAFVDMESSHKCKARPEVLTCLADEIHALSERVHQQGHKTTNIALFFSVKAAEKPIVRLAALPLSESKRAPSSTRRERSAREFRKQLVFGADLHWKDPKRHRDSVSKLLNDFKTLARRCSEAGASFVANLEPRHSFVLQTPGTSGRLQVDQNTFDIPPATQKVRIENLPEQTVTLQATFDGFVPIETNLSIPSDAKAVTLDWTPAPDATLSRTVVQIAGLAGVVAGAVSIGYGASRQNTGTCTGFEGMDCREDGGGPFIALGSGLATMGLAWSMGPFFETEGFPWWSLVSGAVGLAVVSSTLFLIDPGSSAGGLPPQLEIY